MLRRFLLGLLPCAMALATCTIARGEDVLLELYGRGVHAYYSGDYLLAQESLTEAIDAGSKDPRVYYFRGLANAHLGNEDVATADYQQGATIEFSSAPSVDIGKALIRIQGPSRTIIEKARREAKLVAKKTQEQLKKEKYEEQKKNDAAVLRKPDATPPVVETPPPAANDPFAKDKPDAGEAKVETPAAPATEPATTEDASDDPFKDDAAPPAAEGEKDPFGGDSEAPAKTEEEDPFGGN